jgi:Flp pilus assembly protein TadD
VKNQKATKRQLIADAVAASLGGRWEEALSLNDQIISRFSRETEALNRKGRALIELRQLSAARDAYSEALKTDPANMIARRNLPRSSLQPN